MAQDSGFASGGVQQTGEHLKGGGLPGSVRAQESNDFSRLDLEVDGLNRFDLALFAAEDASQGGLHPAGALVHNVRFGEIVNRNRRAHPLALNPLLESGYQPK
jgi:hypothetical protein